jgi:hypothetical protein
MTLTKQDGRPSYVRVNSVTQRLPVPTMRRTLKRFEFGCATREARMSCRPLMRSPDYGYSSTASPRYMSCSTSKSFASDAAPWRLSACRISFSSMLPLPFLAPTGAGLPFHLRLVEIETYTRSSADTLPTRGRVTVP